MEKHGTIYYLFTYHQVLSTLICYWFFSSLVSSLPTPRENSSMLYAFFFKFLQTLQGNLMRIPEIRNLAGVSAKDASEAAKEEK